MDNLDKHIYIRGLFVIHFPKMTVLMPFIVTLHYLIQKKSNAGTNGFIGMSNFIFSPNFLFRSAAAVNNFTNRPCLQGGRVTLALGLP